jgi:hypothetical protein
MAVSALSRLSRIAIAGLKAVAMRDPKRTNRSPTRQKSPELLSSISALTQRVGTSSLFLPARKGAASQLLAPAMRTIK